MSDRWTDGEQVLEANRIKVEMMHRGLTQQKHVDLLNQFQYCDRNGAHMLLISNFDLVGLDISCVNILIMVVRELAMIVKRHHLR